MKGEKYISECMAEMYPSVTFEQAIEWIREYAPILEKLAVHESGYGLAEYVYFWKTNGITLEELEKHAKDIGAFDELATA